MPPTRGANQSQTIATFTALSSPHGRYLRRRLSDERKFARDLLERLQHAIDLLRRVLGRHRDTNATAVRGDGRRNDRMCEDSVVEESPPYDRGLNRLADQDGDHRRLCLPDVESHRSKAVGDAPCVVPE